MAFNKQFTPDDLVLKLLSGNNAGTLYPIETQKCLLGYRFKEQGNEPPSAQFTAAPMGLRFRPEKISFS